LTIDIDIVSYFTFYALGTVVEDTVEIIEFKVGYIWFED
jgi:hypothetical protein